MNPVRLVPPECLSNFFQIKSLKHRLARVHRVLVELHPGNSNLISSPEQIDIKKLGKHGVIGTDTYAVTQKQPYFDYPYFMMGLFDEFSREPSPLKDYLAVVFECKRVKVIEHVITVSL